MKQTIKTHYLFIILILLNILFAVFFGSDFGDSYDEQFRYESALEAIDTYTNPDQKTRITDKGPIYFVTAKFGGDLIRKVNPNLSVIQSWHYIHFVSYILALFGFYTISLNFLTPAEATVSSALFNTQPLLFGHAFINPKDIPFMALFVLTIAVGLEMSKKLCPEFDQVKLPGSIIDLGKRFKADWSGLGIFHKILFLLLILPSGLIIIPLLWSEQVQIWIVSNVNNLQSGLFKNLLDKMAWILFKGNVNNGISMYKLRLLFPNIMTVLILLTLIYVVILLTIFMSETFKTFLGFSAWKDFSKDLLVGIRNPWLLLSGFILGFSISSKSAGILAGVFILYFIWIKQRSKFLPISVGYLGVAFLVLYLSWPGLWENPFYAIYRSIISNSTFTWDGKVFFDGMLYDPQNLPFFYLPTLVGIQLTIPALFLIILGVVVYFFNRNEDPLDPTLFTILFAWIGLPILAIILTNPAIYDNFRHFLFLLPPLFLFAGLGIRFIRSKLKSQVLIGVLILIILLPGLFGIIDLHPYQYIYYNQFIGGVDGAFRKYELDYWYTAYRNTILHLNDVAKPDASVLVTGPTHIIVTYAREDLKIIAYKEDQEHSQFAMADYLITGTRRNIDQQLLPDQKVIYSINRGDAVLSLIRQLD